MKMSKEEILKMPAGREMDALVAEHIFKTPFQKPGHGPCCTCQTCGWSFDDCQCGYSESRDMAWEILEKFAYYELKKLFLRYNVYIENNDNIRSGHSQENTAPLAICKAALLAQIQ